MIDSLLWNQEDPPPFSFQRAPTLEPGDKLDSEQLRKLAKAFNDRLPYFDFAWRVMFYVAGLFRQMRNPDATGFLYPAQLEFFEAYQALERAQGDWPLTGPGEPEGANVSNPLNCYIWGNEGAGIFDEAGRLGDVPLALPGGTIPATPEELWELGKLQRGAVDIETGIATAPAWTAARSWSLIYGGPRSPHGNAYGGYPPSPRELTPCEDPNTLDPFPPPENREVIFSATDAGIAKGYADKVYAGTCQIGPSTTEDYSQHVAGLYRTPWAFYVFLNSGQVDVLPRWAYVEGPYSGPPVLRKTEGWQLVRALNAFACGHRGAEQNLAARSALNEAAATKLTTWLSGAFKAQDFFSTQYALAPARGGLGSDGRAVPITPRFRRASGAARRIVGGTLWTYAAHSGCVISHAFLSTSALFRSATVKVAADGATVRTIQLSDQAPSAIISLNQTGTLTFSLEGDAQFTGNDGELVIELAELVEYKPDISDAVLVQRLVGDAQQGDETDAAGWVAALQANGCILNERGQVEIQTPFSSIVDHPVYQAARRWSQYVRVLPPRNLYGYSVEDGKSVLWFRRYAAGTGGAPERTEVPQGTDGILEGREYIVDGLPGGSVNYAGVDYYVGDHFWGTTATEFYPVASEKVYLLTNGLLDPSSGADLFTGIAEQITRTAPPQGFTNRWVLGAQFKAYHPSQSSLWKPSAYGDYFAINDRATFFSPEIANELSKSFLWHVAYGQKVGTLGNLISECPTGYRYAPLGTVVPPYSGTSFVNQITVPSANFTEEVHRDAFHKSARIYEPDLEIESAEAVTEGGTELVKVTLTGRLHNTIGEPGGVGVGDISRNVATWNLDALQGEPYRTTENAIRMFIAHQWTGRNFVAGYGDNAANSFVQYLPDNPYASCWPHIYLVKMLPEPYADNNTRQDRTDTPLFHDVMTQAETYLRAMCEACVDHEQSLEKLIEYVETYGIPESWGLHDYTFDELCRQAFSGSWIGLMPSEETRYLRGNRVRDDAPHGFGPVPHTYASSEVFNRISSAVNLLTRFRVMLPWTLETREVTYTKTKIVDIPFANNYPGGLTFGYADRQWPLTATAITSEGDWTETSGAEARSFFDLDSTEDSEWRLGTTRVDVQWRVNLQEGSAHSLPDYLTDLFDAGLWGVLAYFTESRNNSTRVESTPGDGYNFAVAWYRWDNGPVDESRNYAAFTNQGTLIAPALPAPTDCGFYSDGSTAESPGGSQSSLQLVIVPGNTMFVEVPLVD